MPTPICRFSFNICQWNIVCNKPLSVQDWQQGEPHWFETVAQRETISPKLAFLPPLKRRRLSDSARLFFESAWQLTENESNIPVVYASQNSEINRSFALWQSLLKESDVSPTSFSLSVHNALVGQWSEMRQVKNETTAITAQQDNLETALLEAYLLLQEGHSRVLVVIVETPLAESYNAKPIIRPPFAYALAMVIEAGNSTQLSLYSEQAVDFIAKSANCDNALTWVKQQARGETQWFTSSSAQGYWQWQMG